MNLKKRWSLDDPLQTIASSDSMVTLGSLAAIVSDIQKEKQLTIDKLLDCYLGGDPF